MKKFARGACAALVVFLACFVATAHADTLYYGGDTSYFLPGYSMEDYNMITAYNDDRVFANVTVPVGQTWQVTGIFEQIGNPDPSVPNPAAMWSFRTGMSTTSQGTEFASGQSTSANTTISNISGLVINGSLQGQLLTVTLPTPVTLAGGQTYWFSLAPEDPSFYNMFVGGTIDHANAVGGPQDNYSLVDINDLYPSAFGGTSIQEWNNDGSMGLLGTEGTPSVPEPSSLVLAASAMGGLLLKSRKWTKA